MPFQTKFSDVQLNIPYDLYSDVISDFISLLSFDSNDKQLLNMVTLNQISDATYVYGGNPKSSPYSNFLCPKNLYELLKHTTWRVNSSEEIEFLLKLPSNSKEVDLDLDLKFFTCNILRRSSRKKSDYPEEKNIAEENNKELLEKSTIRFEETCDIGFIVDPKCLGPLNFVHKEINIKLDLEDQDQNNEESFIKPQYFDETIPLKTKEKDRVLIRFSVDELYKNYSIRVDNENISYKITVSFEILKNQLFNDPSNIYLIVYFKLKNLNECKATRRGGRLTIDRAGVLRNSIICPLIRIKINNGILMANYQQYAQIYEVIKTGDEEYIEKKLEENLERSKYFKQINCVQTFSLKEENVIFVSPFGIFDKARELPEEGPLIKELLTFNDIKKHLTELSVDEIKFLEEKSSKIFNKPFSELLELLFKSLKLYFEKSGIKDPVLWKFQWDNTQWRIQYLIQKYKALEEKRTYNQKSRIIKAPTGSGKTLIFFIDSILHYMFTGERIVIIFPTRILNIEMFQNLTLLIHCLRQEKLEYSCGLFIGATSLKLTNLDLRRTGRTSFPLIPRCPKCLEIDSIELTQKGDRRIGKCNNKKCNHEIPYIFMPREVPNYLPIINIATPDKLYWEGLNANYPFLSLRSFGAPVIKCPKCGRYNSYMKKDVQVSVKDKLKFNCTLRFPDCDGEIDPNNIPLEYKPIGFVILDEIHSIYGFTGIVLSIFFRFMKIIQTMLMKKTDFSIDFESGTATIANEKDFFKALTTQEISPFPKDTEYFSKYFKIDFDKIRYRTTIQSVIHTSVRNAFSRAIINDYQYNNLNTEVENELNRLGYDLNAFKLLLGYLFRKADGYSTSNSIYAFTKRLPNIGVDLRPPIFISGDSSSEIVSKFLRHTSNNQIKCFLANLVISLGMNIKNLNNMILYAAPRSINEQVQTIGRLGRKDVAGHASIFLMPNRPRDEFFYEKFHQILVDIKGYLEVQPIQSTNIFISQMVIYNLIYSLMSGYMRNDYKFCFRNSWPPFLEASKGKINLFGIRFFFELLKKILYVDSLQYKSLEKDIKNLILSELKSLLTEMKRSTHITWMSEYFKIKNKLMNGIRGSKDQIQIRVNEENQAFVENKTKYRFDTFSQEHGITELEE